jgi:peroxiredoxin
MLSYQAGMTKFEGSDTLVFGISEDFTPSQKEFAEKNKLTFPLLSDFSKRQVAKDYGVLMPEIGLANRATFIVDKEGKIQYIEEGKTAVDSSGAEQACSRLHHKG